jgi:hypothetical protein
MARRKTGRYPADRGPAANEVLRKLGGHWPDRELAVTLNRMRCRTKDGETWTTVRVAALREKLGIPPYDPDAEVPKTLSVDAAAKRLGICVGSVHKLIQSGALPATQLMYSAPWKIPLDALDSEAVRIGLQDIAARRPRQAIWREGQSIPETGRVLTGRVLTGRVLTGRVLKDGMHNEARSPLRPRKTKTAPLAGFWRSTSWARAASPPIPLRMSVAPQAR